MSRPDHPATLSRRAALATLTTACLSLSDATATAQNEKRQRPPITAVAFTPDGNALLVGSQAGVSVREIVALDRVTASLDSDLENVHAIQFDARGRRLAVTGGIPGESGVMEWFSWPDQSRSLRVELHADSIYACDFAADGNRCVVASADETCSVLDAGSERPSVRYAKHSRSVLAARFLADSKTVVSASRDQTLRVWDATTGRSLRTFHNHSRDVFSLAVKPTKPDFEELPMIASASADRTVRLWQPTIGRMVRFARLESVPLCVAWCAEGGLIAAGCEDGQVRVIDPQTVKPVHTIRVSDGWLNSISVSPVDTRRMAVGSSSGQVHLVGI